MKGTALLMILSLSWHVVAAHVIGFPACLGGLEGASLFAATPSCNALAWMNGDTTITIGISIDSPSRVGSFSIEVLFPYNWIWEWYLVFFFYDFSAIL